MGLAGRLAGYFAHCPSTRSSMDHGSSRLFSTCAPMMVYRSLLGMQCVVSWADRLFETPIILQRACDAVSLRNRCEPCCAFCSSPLTLAVRRCEKMICTRHVPIVDMHTRQVETTHTRRIGTQTLYTCNLHCVREKSNPLCTCLLYTSDAADE